MPWLDLGELPVSYNTHKSEAFQVFLIPSDELPENMVITYDNWKIQYDHIKMRKVFPDTVFGNCGVTEDDIE